MCPCIGIHKQRLFISLEKDKNGHFKNGHVYLTSTKLPWVNSLQRADMSAMKGNLVTIYNISAQKQ